MIVWKWLCDGVVLFFDYIFLQTFLFVFVLFPFGGFFLFLTKKVTKRMKQKEIWKKRVKYPFLLFRFSLAVLFFWFTIVAFLCIFGKKLYQKSERLFYSVYILLFCFLLGILTVGSWYHTDLVFGAPVALFWLILIKMYATFHDSDDGDDGDDDEEPDPETPTGNAADLYLRSLQRVSN